MFTFASPFHKAFMKDTSNAVVAQLVEHQLPKLRVTSSSLAYRSTEKTGSQTMTICFYIFTRVLLTHFLDILCIR